MKEQTDSKVPEIRFKGFEDEWEEKMLGTVVNVTTGKLDANAMTSNGIYDFYTSGIKKYKIDVAAFTGPAITVAGNGATVGYMHLADGEFNAYQRTYVLNNFTADRRFVFYSTGIRLPKKISEEARTGNIPYIVMDMLTELGLSIPGPTEQTKIGEYFRELDGLIGLHQCKHDKLVALKKAMLQKMFPQPGATTPEIRFKGSSGEWAQKKLGEVMANIANNTLSRANLNDHSGLARNIHYGDILVRFGEVLDVQSDGVPFVSDDAVVKKLMFSNLENGDIVLADAAEDEMVGKCTEIHNVGDQIVLAGLHTIPLRPLLHFAPFYLGYYLNSDGYHDQLLPIMQGTKVLSISKSAIKQTSIYFPVDEAEQEKIGSYFRTLDELISKHATQLQKLQQIKTACLEKMFV